MSSMHRALQGDVLVHHLTEDERGEMVFRALRREYVVRAGDILVMAPGIEHSARSATGGVFLLTVVHADSAGTKIANA